MKRSLAWMTIFLLSSVLCSAELAAQGSSDLPAGGYRFRAAVSLTATYDCNSSGRHAICVICPAMLPVA